MAKITLPAHRNHIRDFHARKRRRGDTFRAWIRFENFYWEEFAALLVICAGTMALVFVSCTLLGCAFDSIEGSSSAETDDDSSSSSSTSSDETDDGSSSSSDQTGEGSSSTSSSSTSSGTDDGSSSSSDQTGEGSSSTSSSSTSSGTDDEGSSSTGGGQCLGPRETCSVEIECCGLGCRTDGPSCSDGTVFPARPMCCD